MTSGPIYENLLSLGAFCHSVTKFMILPNNQIANNVFIGGTTPFSHLEEKIELYQINIYIFSFNAASIQGKQTLLVTNGASLYLMTVPERV